MRTLMQKGLNRIINDKNKNYFNKRQNPKKKFEKISSKKTKLGKINYPDEDYSFLDDDWIVDIIKEEKEKELYKKKKQKAESKMLEIVNNYPELKDTYFQKEEDDFDD